MRRCDEFRNRAGHSGDPCAEAVLDGGRRPFQDFARRQRQEPRSFREPGMALRQPLPNCKAATCIERQPLLNFIGGSGATDAEAGVLIEFAYADAGECRSACDIRACPAAQSMYPYPNQLKRLSESFKKDSLIIRRDRFASIGRSLANGVGLAEDQTQAATARRNALS